ncbi:Hypothetical protein I595_2840 [Croceitalea dokdonensis DOKDO 023]|uniref:Uncharacterized protein n=1 Tax=Croceitalea dokdonensis DOKDO 023 TaxID=1300341 RepID=A0A0P7AFH3_9FLAO|nr:hypothetical protein [Croceitalea dokdonensis]KPM30863.1 Hypothetical protein I595_2840 [Croceitalea dokdonensis DOKDO 023]
MKPSTPLLYARILILCFGASLLLLGVVAYDAYSADIQQKITQVVLNALPDLDHSLAQL